MEGFGIAGQKGRGIMNKGAFTLVELLVVIAIIAILMALLMPALRLAYDQAAAIRCVNSLRQLSIAWLTYVTDNNGKIVDGHIPRNNEPEHWVMAPIAPDGTYTGDNADCSLDDKFRGIQWGLLYSYIKSTKVFHCPADARIDIPDQLAFRSYSITGGMNGERGFGCEPVEVYDEISSPGTKIVFVEESDDRGWNMGSWVIDPGNPDCWIDPLAGWHNDRSTVGFADGHSEKHQWEDKRTIIMNEEQRFNECHVGSPDVRFMHNAYAYRKILP